MNLLVGLLLSRILDLLSLRMGLLDARIGLILSIADLRSCGNAHLLKLLLASCAPLCSITLLRVDHAVGTRMLLL